MFSLSTLDSQLIIAAKFCNVAFSGSYNLDATIKNNINTSNVISPDIKYLTPKITTVAIPSLSTSCELTTNNAFVSSAFIWLFSQLSIASSTSCRYCSVKLLAFKSLTVSNPSCIFSVLISCISLSLWPTALNFLFANKIKIIATGTHQTATIDILTSKANIPIESKTVETIEPTNSGIKCDSACSI